MPWVSSLLGVPIDDTKTPLVAQIRTDEAEIWSLDSQLRRASDPSSNSPEAKANVETRGR